MFSLVVTVLAVPCAICVVFTWSVRFWAGRVGFVDRPGGHKSHTTPVALGGGIAITFAILVPILGGTLAAWAVRDQDLASSLPHLIQTHLPGIASKLPFVLAIVGCTLILHVTGLIDDRRPLGPIPKFAVQFAVALVTAGPMGVRAAEFLPTPLSIAATVVWIVVITNAFNFLDNMDGLSAGVAAIAAAIFAMASMNAGQIFVPVMAWVVVGSLLGFLFFNFSPASIFMGDAGSLVIGYLLSVLTILATYYDPHLDTKPFGVLVPLMVLAVPLYDSISVVIHRLRLGQSPFRGDRRHFSHRLVKRGMTPRGAVLTIYLATAATALPAIILPSLDWLGAILLLIQCLCVVTMIAILEHTGPTEPRA